MRKGFFSELAPTAGSSKQRSPRRLGPPLCPVLHLRDRGQLQRAGGESRGQHQELPRLGKALGKGRRRSAPRLLLPRESVRFKLLPGPLLLFWKVLCQVQSQPRDFLDASHIKAHFEMNSFRSTSFGGSTVGSTRDENFSDFSKPPSFQVIFFLESY